MIETEPVTQPQTPYVLMPPVKEMPIPGDELLVSLAVAVDKWFADLVEFSNEQQNMPKESTIIDSDTPLIGEELDSALATEAKLREAMMIQERARVQEVVQLSPCTCRKRRKRFQTEQNDCNGKTN